MYPEDPCLMKNDFSIQKVTFLFSWFSISNSIQTQNEANCKNLSFYNLIRWFAGPMGQTNRRTGI